jgi:hypothetical protein
MYGYNKRSEEEEDWTAGYEQGSCVIPGAPSVGTSDFDKIS